MDAAATRELLAFQSRSRRRNRSSLREQLESGYIALLTLLVVGSMLVSGGRGLLDATGCSGVVGCLDPQGRPALAAAVALTGWGVLWRVAVMLGPVGSSRAAVSWLLTTPADRRTLLRPPAARALLLGGGYGALVGWLVVSALDPPDSGPIVVTAALIIGAAAGLVTVAIAIAGQPSRRSAASPVPGFVALAAAAGLSLAALAPWPALGGLTELADIAKVFPMPLSAALGSVAVGAAVAVAVGVTDRRLGRVPVAELLSAGSAQDGVHGSVIMLDTRYAGPTLASRQRRSGRARSRRGSGAGLVALLLRDLHLLLRRPGTLLAAVGYLLVPALLLALTGGLLAELVAVLLALQVARSAARSLHTVQGSPGLERSLPFSVLATTGVLLVVPVVVTLAWSSAVGAVLGLAPWSAVVLSAAAVAGVLRAATRADGGGPGLLVMTDAGPVPVGLVTSLVRGPDVTLLAASPLLLGAGPLTSSAVAVSLAGALLAWTGLRR